MERPTCSTCPYWHIPPDGPSVGVGECRIEPPSIAGFAGDDEDIELTGYWPRTVEDDWCGRHPDFPRWMPFNRPYPADEPPVPDPE